MSFIWTIIIVQIWLLFSAFKKFLVTNTRNVTLSVILQNNLKDIYPKLSE